VKLLFTSINDFLWFIIENMQASPTSWQREPFKAGVPLPYKAAFNHEQFARLREGLIPQQMENKWFIYYEEPHLFLHRSWTGAPVYRLTLGIVPGGAKVTEALWSKVMADAANFAHGAKYQARLLDFLLSNLLLGQSKLFPVPFNLRAAKYAIYQHVVSGTGYPSKKAWWRIW
jgi:hypothetical protein